MLIWRCHSSNTLTELKIQLQLQVQSVEQQTQREREREGERELVRSSTIAHTAMAQKCLNLIVPVLLVAVMVCDAAVAQSFDVEGFLRPQNAARAELGLAPLQWDGRLANYAQGWAAQRKAYGDCRLQHSGGPYGENIFWGSGKAWRPEEAAGAWVSEKRWYRYYSNSCMYYNKCGHYTQVVWRGTTRVGCARSVCNDGNIFMTCNYYPPGNWVGQRPY